MLGGLFRWAWILAVGDICMVLVQPRLWLSDRIAWIIFAAGVAAMFGVLYVSLAFGGYEDTFADWLDRARLRTSIFFGMAAMAISGPLMATIGHLIACRAWRPSAQNKKFVDLDL
jgi:hypothetical protein